MWVSSKIQKCCDFFMYPKQLFTIFLLWDCPLDQTQEEWPTDETESATFQNLLQNSFLAFKGIYAHTSLIFAHQHLKDTQLTLEHHITSLAMYHIWYVYTFILWNYMYLQNLHGVPSDIPIRQISSSIKSLNTVDQLMISQKKLSQRNQLWKRCRSQHMYVFQL